MSCRADGYGYGGVILGASLDGDGDAGMAAGTWSNPGPTLRTWDAARQILLSESERSTIGPFYQPFGGGVPLVGINSSLPGIDDNWQYVCFRPPPTLSVWSVQINFGSCWLRARSSSWRAA